MPSTSRRIRRIAQCVLLLALFASCQVYCPFDSESKRERAPRQSPPEETRSSRGCGGGWSPAPSAGANDEQRGPGNGDSGVALGLGDIAVAPDGTYILAKHHNGLIHVDLSDGLARWVGEVEEPERLAFAPDGQVIYVFEVWSGRVVAVDLAVNTTLWSREVHPGLGIGDDGQLVWLLTLQVTPDGSAVVVQGRYRVEVLDAVSGNQLYSHSTSSDVLDVDVIQGGGAIVITERETWGVDDSPNARLTVMSLTDGTKTTIDVPNCGSELVVAPDGITAMMASSDCAPPSNALAYDPISLIDLATASFVRNLPGFGPVQITPDGATAVGFLDMNDVDATLFDDPTVIPPLDSARYHLLLVDLSTYDLRTVELGAVLPRYAMTPNGNVLLVDSDFFGNGAQLRILNLATLELIDVDQTDIRLDNFVVTSDSAWVYLLHSGLWEVEIASASATWVDLQFAPTNINITPDDSRLLLRQTLDTLHVWQRDLREVVLTIHFVEALGGVSPPGETTIGQ